MRKYHESNIPQRGSSISRDMCGSQATTQRKRKSENKGAGKMRTEIKWNTEEQNMQPKFDVALNNPLIADISQEIFSLWQSLGSPDQPTGPSSTVRGTLPAFLEPSEIEGLPEAEAIIQAQRYNNAIEQLLELTGIWHAGGASWHTCHNPGTPEWLEYTEESWELAMDFIANELWDRFCNTI